MACERQRRFRRRYSLRQTHASCEVPDGLLTALVSHGYLKGAGSIGAALVACAMVALGVTSNPLPEFYIYRLYSDDGALLYVGKGSGRRLLEQSRRYGLSGAIIAYFDTEDEAYRAERLLIARLKPHLNRAPGGFGGKRRL